GKSLRGARALTVESLTLPSRGPVGGYRALPSRCGLRVAGERRLHRVPRERCALHAQWKACDAGESLQRSEVFAAPVSRHKTVKLLEQRRRFHARLALHGL